MFSGPMKSTDPMFCTWFRENAGKTNLHKAVLKENLEAVYNIIREIPPEDLSQKLNAIDFDRNTALHYAAKWGCPDIVLVLLKAGAEKNIINRFGQTPLQLAHIMLRGKVQFLTKQSDAKKHSKLSHSPRPKLIQIEEIILEFSRHTPEEDPDELTNIQQRYNLVIEYLTNPLLVILS